MSAQQQVGLCLGAALGAITQCSVVAISLRRFICGPVLYLFHVTYDVSFTTIALFFTRSVARAVPSMHSVQQPGQSEGPTSSWGAVILASGGWGHRKQGMPVWQPRSPSSLYVCAFRFRITTPTANNQDFASEFCYGVYPCRHPQPLYPTPLLANALQFPVCRAGQSGIIGITDRALDAHVFAPPPPHSLFSSEHRILEPKKPCFIRMNTSQKVFLNVSGGVQFGKAAMHARRF